MEETQNVMMMALAPMMERIAEKVAEKVAEKMKEELKPSEPKYYGRKETAEILRISLPTLAAATARGLLTAKKVGRRVLYDARQIDKAAEGPSVKYRKF